MEINRSGRRNTIEIPKRRSVSKKHRTFKAQNNDFKKEETDKENISFFDISKHEGSKFIRGTKPTNIEFKKFVTLFYRGLYYSINNLKGPSEEFLKKKSITLQEPKNAKNKFLLLDLDETLIHSVHYVFMSEKTDVSFMKKGGEFNFNIRPYCFEFLQKMSEYYTIYVFTASTADYAQPIVDYLNEKCKTIHGVLHRKNCMETHNGFYIKDLRIIKNRGLKDLILVDNLVHSFGLQLDNGIPVLEYLSGKEDKELQGIEEILIELSKVEDVRPAIKDILNIREILNSSEEEFIQLENKKYKTMKL